MSVNTALVTDAAKGAAQQALDDYADGVAAHLSGDWGKHNQARIYALFFNEPVSGHQVSTRALRLRLTQAGTDKVLIIPALATTADPDPSGTPLIITQPASQTVYVGATATFSVTASASLPVTYQWRKNSTDLTGKTSSSLVLTNCQTSDQASYSVVVTTDAASVTSDEAALTVLALPSGGGGTGGGDTGDDGGNWGTCFKAGTVLTRANGFGIAIEQVTPGTVLKSLALEGLNPNVEMAWQTWKANSLKAVPASTTVVSVRHGSYRWYYVINGRLEVTFEHPLLVLRGSVWQWLRADEVQIGDFLYRNGGPEQVKTKLRINQSAAMCNIDVEPYDVYWANGYVVHNLTLPDPFIDKL